MENNGKALAELRDAEGNVVVKKGDQISLFAQLRDDGTTTSGYWVFAGSWTAAGVTRWHDVITPILLVWAIRRGGPGPGR